MVFASTLEELEHTDEGLFLHVPNDIAHHFLDRSGPAVKCLVEGNVSFNGAIQAAPNGQHVIRVSHYAARCMGLERQQLLYLELSPGTDLLSLQICEKLSKALRANRMASQSFYGLSTGDQHSIVYFVNDKHTDHSEDTKVLAVIRYLSCTEGCIDFKKFFNETLQLAAKMDE